MLKSACTHLFPYYPYQRYKLENSFPLFEPVSLATPFVLLDALPPLQVGDSYFARIIAFVRNQTGGSAQLRFDVSVGGVAWEANFFNLTNLTGNALYQSIELPVVVTRISQTECNITIADLVFSLPVQTPNYFASTNSVQVMLRDTFAIPADVEVPILLTLNAVGAAVGRSARLLLRESYIVSAN